MRVLHVMMDRAEASGVVTFVREIASAMAELGVESEILTETDPIPEAIDADIVHIHGLWRPYFHKIVARLRRAPNRPVLVWSTHGMTAPWSMRHKGLKKKIAWWLYQRKDLRRAAFVHATVEKEREWNAALGFKGNVVIPLGTRLSAPAADRVRRRTLLFVGRLYPVKAIDSLIRAFALVPPEKRRDWSLRLVGPDEAGHQAELEKLVAELGTEVRDLASRVVFAGPKFGEALQAEYADCTALALVSHTENFGATVVDAMSHAKPVITSTNTPWQEVAEVGAGSWVANDPPVLAKALEELFAASSERLAEMGAAGRALVERKYTWTAVARAMEKAYRAVLT